MEDRIIKSFVEKTNTPGKWKDSELRGFGLKITPKLKKIYIVENSVRGGAPKVTVTIGPHGVWTAEDARAEAKRLLLLMSQGINPNDQLKVARKQREREQAREEQERKENSITLSMVLEDYLRSRGSSLKESTRSMYRCVIGSSLKDWTDLPIKEITKDMVERRHREITEEGKLGAANSAMRVLRALFSYATVAYESAKGEPLITNNPVKRLSDVKAWNRLERRQGVIKNHELYNWHQAVLKLRHQVVQDFLLFLLFTGLRRNEASLLTWDHVDFRARTIFIPDPKNRQPHMLPMTDFLYTLLKRREKEASGPLVFTPTRGGAALKDVRADLAKIEEESGIGFILHDLRRTFITTAESLDIPYYAIKRLANHKDGSDVTVGYIVSDVERLREPMQKISDHLQERITTKPADANPAPSRSRQSK